MKFNNGKKIVVLRLISLIATSLFVIYILLAYFAKVFRQPEHSHTLDIISAAVTLFYLTLVLWPLIRQYKYIYFTDEGSFIMLRWYSVGLISGASKSIEIPKNNFAGYEIKTKFSGFNKCIILHQYVHNQRAGYPPVSLNVLRKTQVKKITDALDHYK